MSDWHRTGRQFLAADPRAVEAALPVDTGRGGRGVSVHWWVEPSGEGSLVGQRVEVTARLRSPGTIGRAEQIARSFRLDCARLARSLDPGARRCTPGVVVIAGGSGELGRALSADLTCRGHDVVVLTRAIDPDLPFRQSRWDGRTQGQWAAELIGDRPTRVVNLAGRLVDARPTAVNIAALRDSRVEPTLALVQAAQSRSTPISHWVQASTTAIWSDGGEAHLTESSPLPTGSHALPQMTGVAQPWESAVAVANTDRLVVLRTSIVLVPGSPAWERLVGMVRRGLGGSLGDGNQWFSWIHLQDWLAITRASLGLEPGVRVGDGVLVASSPEPVRNRDLMATLRGTLHRPWSPPTPELVVRTGSVVLRTDPALGLTGRHCSSAKLGPAGFTFAHPGLREALADLLS